jgi:hypothetical protein
LPDHRGNGRNASPFFRRASAAAHAANVHSRQPCHSIDKTRRNWRTRRDSNSRPLPSEGMFRGVSKPWQTPRRGSQRAFTLTVLLGGPAFRVRLKSAKAPPPGSAITRDAVAGRLAAPSEQQVGAFNTMLGCMSDLDPERADQITVTPVAPRRDRGAKCQGSLLTRPPSRCLGCWRRSRSQSAARAAPTLGW